MHLEKAVKESGQGLSVVTDIFHDPTRNTFNDFFSSYLCLRKRLLQGEMAEQQFGPRKSPPCIQTVQFDFEPRRRTSHHEAAPLHLITPEIDIDC
jgi:hypothetical protein